MTNRDNGPPQELQIENAAEPSLQTILNSRG
jgi:hypothetical protein